MFGGSSPLPMERGGQSHWRVGRRPLMLVVLLVLLCLCVFVFAFSYDTHFVL